MSSSSIRNRSDFIERQESEKNTLVQIEATTRLINWNLVSGGLYNRSVDQFTVRIADCVDELTQVGSIVDVVPGTWFYDTKSGEISINLLDDSDPNLTDIVATYRFFYSDTTMTASYNMTNEGVHVLYDSRLASAPGYNHKIGYEQNLTSVVGQGSLKLHNQDGALDDIFDRYYFENQSVKVYSWNRELDFSEAQIIYRGRVTNKSFNSEQITFTVKDPMYDLNQPVPTGVYEDGVDDVSSSLFGKSKRWIYGRVDGLRVESLDKIENGYLIAGTATVEQDTNIIIGTGTSFLTDLSIGDELTLNDEKYTIDSIFSDTQATINSILKLAINNLEIFVKPKLPPVSRNRNYQVSSHAISESQTEITEVIQLNRVRVVDNSSYFAGDIIELGNSGERIGIKSIGQNGLIVFQQSAVNVPVVGELLNRVAIQNVYIGTERILEDDFVVNNGPDGCFIVIDTDAEENIADVISTAIQGTFITNSRVVQVTGDEDRIKEVIEPNVLIRSTDITSTEFQRVLGVQEIPETEIDFEDYLNANFPISAHNSFEFFPITGVTGQIYRALDANQLYAWNGSAYNSISDINDAPATNYNTTNKLYLSDEDRFNYAIGMTITIITDDIGDWITTISDLSRVEGDSWIELGLALPRVATSDDKIGLLNVVNVRDVITEPTNSGLIQYKSPDWLSDTSIVSVDSFGKTKDNTVHGEWIRTGSETVEDIVRSMGIDEINQDEFDRANLEAPQIISLTVPQSSAALPQDARTTINLINKSIIGSLNMDNELDLQYTIIQPNIDEENIPQVNDFDLISWQVNTVNGKVIRDVGLNYRHMDYQRTVESKGSLNVEYSYDFVDKYIMTETRDDIDCYIYTKFDAEIRAHREAYHRSLSRSDITLVSDLRLENYKIGDSIVLNIDRLYRRLGDNFKKKVVMVVGKKVTGNRITLYTTDFGNLYNRSNIITRNDAPCYEDATSEEKLKLGFITDNRGIIDDDENINNTQLIS